VRPVNRDELVSYTIEKVRGPDEWDAGDVEYATQIIEAAVRVLLHYGLDLEGPFVLAVVREEMAGVDT
jgi:hypothetical protein